MIIRFETCERGRALRFLQKFYPSRTIADSPESAGPVLDLVEQDIIRIPDPDYHSGAIYPSANYKESMADEVAKTLNAFHEGDNK